MKGIYKKDKVKKDKRIQVRVTEEEMNIFDKLCKEMDLDKSKLVLTLIKREYHKQELSYNNG